MRIFQIITLSELGGAQSIVLNLANNYINEHQVFVVAGGEGPMWEQLDDRIKQIKIRSLQRTISPLDFLVWFKLLWIGLRFRPDIVHLHSSKIGLLGRLAFSKKKIIYTVHGFDSIRVAYRKFLPIEKFLQKRTQAIVAVSRYDEKKLIQEGITNNVHTIYNGIATNKIKNNIILAESIKYIENNEKKIKIICIARLSPPKNFKLFCEIANELPDIAFFWVGNQYVPSLLFPENVTLLGEVPCASRLNHYVDIAILVSNYEGMPISIIEALSYSKPVVASDVGGISEILNDENGFTVCNTVDAFKEKILFYKNHADEYEKACIAARKTYEKLFTVEKMVNAYLNVYKTVSPRLIQNTPALQVV